MRNNSCLYVDMALEMCLHAIGTGDTSNQTVLAKIIFNFLFVHKISAEFTLLLLLCLDSELGPNVLPSYFFLSI